MINEYAGYIIIGLCTGLGSSIGNYIAMRLFIKRVEQLENIIKNNGGDKDETHKRC